MFQIPTLPKHIDIEPYSPTAAQRETFLDCQKKLGGKLLDGDVILKQLRITYYTNSGRVVVAIYDEQGTLTQKDYYKSWNDKLHQPEQHICRRHFFE